MPSIFAQWVLIPSEIVPATRSIVNKTVSSLGVVQICVGCSFRLLTR